MTVSAGGQGQRGGQGTVSVGRSEGHATPVGVKDRRAVGRRRSQRESGHAAGIDRMDVHVGWDRQLCAHPLVLGSDLVKVGVTVVHGLDRRPDPAHPGVQFAAEGPGRGDGLIETGQQLPSAGQ